MCKCSAGNRVTYAIIDNCRWEKVLFVGGNWRGVALESEPAANSFHFAALRKGRDMSK